MNLIFINTTLDEAFYAVICGDKVFRASDTTKAKQSEKALVYIDDLLAEAGIGIDQVDVIATCIGPGSFTGIRVAMSISKGLNCALPNIKLVTFNNLEVYAQMFPNYEYLFLPAQRYFYGIQSGKKPLKYALYNREQIDELPKESYKIIEENIDFETMISIVKHRVLNSEFVSQKDIKPMYLMKSQAEVELEKREVRNNGNQEGIK